jgi:hypothetical protein
MAELKDWQKAALYAGGIAGALGLGYFAIKSFLQPGATGGPCTDPSTPCGASIQPWVQQYQNCANQYANYMNQFLKEDSANGTGLTQSQLSTLNTLQQCMDQAANNIATIAKQYTPTQVTAVLAYWGAAALGIVATAYGIATIIKSLRTSNVPYSGAAVGNAIKNALTELAGKLGIISPESATALSNQLPTLASSDISDSNAFFDALSSAEILSVEDAVALADDEASAILDDASAVIDFLASLR